MVEKRQLNVKIPVELYDKIESSDKTQVAIVTEALEKYFGSNQQEDNSREIANLLSQINYLQSENSKLLYLFSREQALHLQTQKMLPEKSEKEGKKQWWQFWKR